MSASLPQRTVRALDRNPDVIKVSDGNFLVEGRSKDWYSVDLEALECSCPDYEHRRSICYHMRAAALKDAWGEIKTI